MASSEYLGAPLCEVMHLAHYKLNDLSYETLNRLWRRDFRTDHRFKIKFGGSSLNSTYLMWLGKTEYVVEFKNGKTYCRPCARQGNPNHSLYDRKPCFETVSRNGGIRTRWQHEVTI